MKEAADKAGKLLMVGFTMRFSNENEIAEDFIKQGYLGDIYYSKATYIRRHGAPGGWFSKKKYQVLAGRLWMRKRTMIST